MANSISGTVWRIDTLPFTYKYPVKITGANWTDQTAVGNQIVVKDNGGNTIIDSKAQQVNFQQNFGNLGWQTGITVTTLDSGVLTISVGGGK